MFNEYGDALKRLYKTAKHEGKRPAVTCAQTQEDEAGTSYVTPKDIEHDNKIFVFIDGDTSKAVSVWNLPPCQVDYIDDLAVYVGEDAGGKLSIVEADKELMNAEFGEAARTVLLGQLAGDLIKLILPSRNFKPLRVRPHETGGLNIVIEPHRYEYGVTSYVWDDPSAYDLSAVTVTSGYRKPVIIGIDPSTQAITTATGAERSLAMPAFTLTEYNTVVSANPGKLWLAGYARTDGVTSFQTLQDLVDLRAWLTPGGGIANGNSFMPIDLDFPLTIADNQQVPIRRLNIVAGGVLTVSGVLDIIA